MDSNAFDFAFRNNTSFGKYLINNVLAVCQWQYYYILTLVGPKQYKCPLEKSICSCLARLDADTPEATQH